MTVNRVTERESQHATVTAERGSTSPEDVVTLQKFTPSRSWWEWALIRPTDPLWADFERKPFNDSQQVLPKTLGSTEIA